MLTISVLQLGLKAVDLYLIHNPRSVSDYPDIWTQFERFRKEGLTRYAARQKPGAEPSGSAHGLATYFPGA